MLRNLEYERPSCCLKTTSNTRKTWTVMGALGTAACPQSCYVATAAFTCLRGMNASMNTPLALANQPHSAFARPADGGQAHSSAAQAAAHVPPFPWLRLYSYIARRKLGFRTS